jgi:hypothetical protein
MRTKKLWVCFILVIGTLVLLAVKTSRADDVYNFYFQKAPGPTTVIQGGGQPPKAAKNDDDAEDEDKADTVHQDGVKSSPAPETNQNSTKAETALKPEEKKSFSRWRFMLGKASYGGGSPEFNDGTYYSGTPYQSGEWVLGVQFNIWKSLGIDLRLLQPVGQALTGGAGMGRQIGSAGLDFSPFHIRIAGYELLDLGFTAGYTGVSTQDVNTLSYCQYGYNSCSAGGQYTGHQNTYYYGLKASVNIGDSFAVVGAAEAIPQIDNSSRLTFGAVFKL